MATSVVETPRIVATLPTRPQDGDDAYMDAGAAPLMPVLQHLYDAAGALRIAVLGQMSGGDRLSVDPGGTSTVFAVRVSRIVGLLSRQTGSTPIYATYTAGETTLDLTDVDGAPAGLANDTWYYVYAFCDGTATTAFYISTTAPEASLTWRTGAEGVDRYVGCFRTNGSGAPLAMRMHRGRYAYRPFYVQALAFGNSTSFAAVDLSSVVPPHARIAHLRLNLTGSYAAQLRTTGAASGYATFGEGYSPIEIEADSAQSVDYLVSNALANLDIEVTGFAE
jgi:hypothetical protein